MVAASRHALIHEKASLFLSGREAERTIGESGHMLPSGHDHGAQRDALDRSSAVAPSNSFRGRPYRAILVPLDGSAFAEHALPHAVAIARRAHADLRLVHAHCPLDAAEDPGLLFYEGGLNARCRERKMTYLNSLVARIAKLAPVRVTSVVIEGRGVVDCLSAAANQCADLVVMATHPRGRLARLVRRSVSTRLIRRLAVPLLVVRGHKAPPDLCFEPPVRRVLTALDGSPAAERVLAHALAIGRLTGAEHTLLQIVNAVNEADREPAGQGLLACLQGGRVIEALRYVQRLVDDCQARAHRMHGQVMYSESTTAAAILSHAAAEGADLIALARHPRRHLFPWLRSSVTYDVMRGANTPVLIDCSLPA